MKVYVVHGSYHYDDYKRGESYSTLDGVFFNEDDAYKLAVEKYMKDFEEHARYNWDSYKCNHEIDPIELEENGRILCVNCEKPLCLDGSLDLGHKDNHFSEEHLNIILTDVSTTAEQKYDYIMENLYENILPQPEYSLQPTHTRYFVEEMEVS